MLFTALAAPSLPLGLAAGAVIGLVLLPWLLALPRLALFSFFASLLVGQIVRLPLPGQSGGLLLSDVATVVVLLSALLKFSLSSKHPHPNPLPIQGEGKNTVLSLVTHYSLLVTPFLLFSLWTNLIHWSPTPSENLVALAYWARLSATLLLLPALLILFSSRITDYRLRITTHYSLLITTAALCLLGLLQWWFLPDLSFLARYGWDPHQGRLVSTWLDPNLFGAFLLITIPYLLSRVTGYGLLIPALATLALFLTESRSSLLALLLTTLIFSPLFIHYLIKRYHKRGAVALVAITGLLIATCLVAIFFLGDRAHGLLTIDITAQLRLESIQTALPLAGEHLLTGVGYNRYQFAAKAAGGIDNFSLHSRAGADNSLLTLLITTGLLGVFLFFIPWVAASRQLLKKQAFPTLFSMTTLLIHSQFVNSFLYSHLLIALIIVVALSLSKRNPLNPLYQGEEISPSLDKGRGRGGI